MINDLWLSEQNEKKWQFVANPTFYRLLQFIYSDLVTKAAWLDSFDLIHVAPTFRGVCCISSQLS
jgi:hypothetical protein